jgi:hypothetical protein
MSGLIKNEITLYLKPISSLQPYQINDCARWLVSLKRFEDYHSARLWLNYLEQHHVWRFKAIMADYFNATDYAQDFIDKRDVNAYRSSASNSYGDEPHMWF